MAKRSPRVYDHRLREQVVRTGNPDLFPELGIPRKTALSWIRRGTREVVTLEDEAWAPAHHVRIARLERRVAMLAALLRLVLTLLRVSGFELERARVPDAANKRRLLSAIERARKAMPLSAALRVIRLSLDNLSTVRKLVAFYVAEHNQTMPHNAFQGQTPDEMYLGHGAHVPDELAARRQAARQHRVATNRSAACSACPRAAPRSREVAA